MSQEKKRKEKITSDNKEDWHGVAKVDNEQPGPQAALGGNLQGLCLLFQETERIHGVAWTRLNAWDAAKTGSLEFSEQTLLLKRAGACTETSGRAQSGVQGRWTCANKKVKTHRLI